MANIPTIPGTQMVQDQPIGVKMDPTAGLKLNAQVAETVGTAAAVISQYEEKKQKAVEFDIANKSYLSFTALRQKFDEDTKTLAPDQIVSHWEQTANEWKASQAEQYNSKLSPEARQEFNANWDKAIIGTRGDAQVIADRKKQADFEGTLNDVVAKAADSGDPAQLKPTVAVIDTGVTNGFITKGKASELKYKLTTQSAFSQASHLAEQNPQEAINAINNGKYPDIINTAKREAVIRQALDQQRFNLTTLVEENTDPDTGQIPENVIKDNIKSGKISLKAGNNIIVAQKRQDYKADVDISRDVKAITRDPSTWLEGDASEIANGLLEQASGVKNKTVRDGLYAYINKQVAAIKKTGATSEPSYIRNGINELNNDALNASSTIYKAINSKSPNLVTSKNPEGFAMSEQTLKRYYSGYGNTREEIIKNLESINAKQQDEFTQKMEDFVASNKRIPTNEERLTIKNSVLKGNITANVMNAFHGKSVGAPIPYKSNVVFVTAPDGTIGTINNSDLSQALSLGYKIKE